MYTDKHADFLIIGAGIVGITIAETLKKKFPDARIILLEKENSVGLHSSGRNSGVMHSGIYYSAESIKAKVCGQGAREMVDWCEDRNIGVKKIGKVIVPIRKEDGAQIDLLLERARINGVNAIRIDDKELRVIEPEARSASGEAIFCSDTSVIDPKAVLQQKVKELKGLGVSIHIGTAFHKAVAAESRLYAGANSYTYGYVINAAGLHADKVAHAFGVGRHLIMLPFKGMYWKLSPESKIKLNHLVYPVPDLRVPFLGVHTTTAADGNIYLGPTAAPAFGRENYQGFEGINLGDASSILYRLAEQFAYNKQGFRALVCQEVPKYFKSNFYQAAKAVLPNLEIKDLLPCAKVGIRAQMLDINKKELVTDFIVKKQLNQIHILNAISPAFTSSIPFARMVVDKIT